MLNTYRKSRTD